MVPHGRAEYKQHDARPADQELGLGAGREVSLQRDLPGSTNRREWSSGKAMQFDVFIH